MFSPPDLIAIAPVGVVILVLLIDFVFRRDVYNRSDPLSFSILCYSLLLIVPTVLLKILAAIRAQPERHDAPPSLLISAIVYFVGLFIIQFFARNAHKALLQAQEKRIAAYLRSHWPTHAQSDVRDALEALGNSVIEPDVFVKNRAKAKKRVEYLQLVKRVTGSDSIKTEDQEDLLASEGRLAAQIWYVITFLFGLTSTLVFYLLAAY
jgi:hypothetical protein